MSAEKAFKQQGNVIVLGVSVKLLTIPEPPGTPSPEPAQKLPELPKPPRTPAGISRNFQELSRNSHRNIKNKI